MTVGLPVAGSHGGFFTISADGTVIFDPAGAFADLGPSEFRDTGVAVTVTDNAGASATSTLIARVRAVSGANPGPTSGAPLSDRAVSSGVPVTPFSVAGAFGDPGDVLAFSAAGLPAGLSIDAASGIVSGTPMAGPGTAFVLVTATDTAGQTAVASFSMTVDAAPSAPVLLDPPAITGAAAIGATLTAEPGRWAGRPVPSVTHQWRRNGIPIIGATAANYVVMAADAAASLTLAETAANTEGSAMAVSVAVNVPAGGTPVPPAAAGALPDQSYTQGATIAPFDTGADFTGTGLSFALAPASAALPVSLGLDPANGMISGTPTEVVAARAIVIRATNSAGTADSAFSLTIMAADTTAPVLAATQPANGATDVDPGIRPVVSFSEPVRLGTGNVTLRDVTGGIDVEVFDVAGPPGTGPGQLSISGSDLTVTPSASLQPGAAYAVRIAPGALEDLAGNPFAGIIDDTTLAFTTAAPSTTANFAAVNADGWTASYPSAPAAINAGTDNRLSVQERFAVTRAGFDTAGNAIAFNEDLTVLARLRQAYPNQASLAADQVTLSDFVYSGDTVAGATNSSTRAAPKPVALWLHRDLEVASGPSHTVRLAVAHRHARSGRPVAAVKFTATDGANTVETTVSAMTKVSYTASGLSVPCFEGVLDFGSLTPGLLVTVDAVIYPWVGSAFTISSDASPYPHINLTTMRVWNGPLTPVYAYVDSSAGNDGTGVASTNSATASAAPFLTVPAAISAASTANGGNVGNCHIRLKAGTYVHSSFSAQTEGSLPLIIEGDPASTPSAVIYQGPASHIFDGISNLVVFKDLTLKQGASGVFWLDSSAGGAVYDHMMAFEGCIFDDNGSTLTGPEMLRTGRCWMINCTTTGVGNAGWLRQFGANQKMAIVLGCGGKLLAGGNSQAYHVVGNKSAEAQLRDVQGTAEFPSVEGQFIGWNKLMGTTETILSVDAPAIGSRGLALVGNVLEKASVGQPVVNLQANLSNSNATNNVVDQQNTIVGERTIIVYTDQDTTTVEKLYQARASVHDLMNMKSDVFAAQSLAVGNWAPRHRVGWDFNCFIRGDNNTGSPGPSGWMGEFPSELEASGTLVTPIVVDWVTDASARGTGAGDGDYRPGASTALPIIPAGLAPYPFDQNGAPVVDDGTARAGALQP